MTTGIEHDDDLTATQIAWDLETLLDSLENSSRGVAGWPALMPKALPGS
jgi:hypothetical protein